MLILSTTHRPATDLGYLLHKHPGRAHAVKASFGTAHICFPEASEEFASVLVALEIDPVTLVRGKGHEQGSLANYINDRPYVASSFLSVAIGEAFGTAMGGRSKERQALADTPIPLKIELPVVPCRPGEELLARLFAPLGYEVAARRLPLDEKFPEWGESIYYHLELSGTVRLRDALRHLYLLLPAIDAKKHYYMDDQEVNNLLRKGEGWLLDHPEREWIVRASLGRRPSLVRAALEQLSNAEAQLEPESEKVDEAFIEPEASAETETEPTSLGRIFTSFVTNGLWNSPASSARAPRSILDAAKAN